jgi:hypothetical protein
MDVTVLMLLFAANCRAIETMLRIWLAMGLPSFPDAD